jgi:hypothetical protein
LITDFEQKIKNKKRFAEAIIHQSITAPYPSGADLRMGHAGREREQYLQNNIKTKPDYLKLNKTDTSMWPYTTDS